MSKYTTELRFICETKSGFDMETIASKTPDEIIDASRTAIFNFNYPIYDETHRPVLEKKIIKHYYTREIGAETVSLWQLQLNATMNDIMPRYNKLYEFEYLSLGKDLKNIDVTKSSTRTDNLRKDSDYTRTDNLTDTNTHNDTTRDRFSDTPQGTISNVDNDSYLTEYRNIANLGGGSDTHTGTQRNAGSDVNTGTQTYSETETGYRGGKTYYELLYDYSEKVLNIDLMIIKELSDLFFKLW